MSENTSKTGKKLPRTAWKEGKSGNPGGRPKMSPELREVIENAKANTQVMLDVLYEIATDPDNDKKARIMAADKYMDRGMGKPTQYVNQRTEVTLGPVFLPRNGRE